MKILFAIDGSPRALSALESLVRRLNWFRDNVELTLIYAHAPLPYKRAMAWAGKDAVHSYYEEESEEAIGAARRLLEQEGIAYAVEKRIGEAAHEIVDHATVNAFDLIALGTHGHTALANLVLGSVATRVLAISKVPVLFL